MNLPTNEVKASDDKNKTPRWLLVAAGGALVLVPPVWLFLGRESEPTALTTKAAPLEQQKITAPLPQIKPSAEFDKQLEQARALLAAKKPEESLPLLERCRQEQPNAFAVHNNLCVAYGMLGRRDAAVAACQRAVELEPKNQLGKNNLAWVSGIKPSTAAR